MSIKLIIIKESVEQVLYSMEEGFYGMGKKYCRVLRAHNVLDIITHYERDIDTKEAEKMLYSSFYVKYNNDDILEYILCYGQYFGH